jgi:hypothetical protein
MADYEGWAIDEVVLAMAGSHSDPDPPPAVLIAAGEDLLDKARAVAAGICGRVGRIIEEDDPAPGTALDGSSAALQSQVPFARPPFRTYS